MKQFFIDGEELTIYDDILIIVDAGDDEYVTICFDSPCQLCDLGDLDILIECGDISLGATATYDFDVEDLGYQFHRYRIKARLD